MMDYIKTTISEVIHPSPDYALIRFVADRPIEGEPGQFVMIRGEFGNDPILPRAFSLVESGENGAVLVRAVGKATKLLVKLKLGETLNVLGPLGNKFELPTKDCYPILVAGGVGVAPLMFLAKVLLQKGIGNTFVYGGRTAADILFKEQIEKMSKLLITTEDGSLGTKGRVTDILPLVFSDTKKAVMYSCGPEPMLRALSSETSKRGTVLHAALEQVMACGMGTCKGCAIKSSEGKFKYVCSDGPVFSAADIWGGEQ